MRTLNQFLIYVLARPSKRKKQLLKEMFERDGDSRSVDTGRVGQSADVTADNHVTGKYLMFQRIIYPFPPLPRPQIPSRPLDPYPWFGSFLFYDLIWTWREIELEQYFVIIFQVTGGLSSSVRSFSGSSTMENRWVIKQTLMGAAEMRQ